MIKAMRVENTVICVIHNKMYRKDFKTDSEILAVYEKALNTDEDSPEDVESLLAMLTSESVLAEKKKAEEEYQKAKAEVESQKSLLDWMEDIKNLGDEHFEVIGIRLYMKGINITIPEFLAKEFAVRRENKEDLNAMMNFWRLCALNTDPRCREDLYKFLVNNNLALTPSGYFVAYRNVNIKEEGINKVQENFVVKYWAKVKVWKKSPKNYSVIFNNDTNNYDCVVTDKLSNYQDDYQLLGTLDSVYNRVTSSGNSTVYTDAHSGKTTIIIGTPVSIPRSECDANPDRTCSRGLHAANASWLKDGYFGEVGLAVLVNPMHVVAVPYTDGGKLRCCEYLPISVIEYDKNGNVIPLDTKTFEYDYAVYTQQELEDMVKNSQFEELKAHDIIPKELSLLAFNQIKNELSETLAEMTKVVKSRTIKV